MADFRPFYGIRFDGSRFKPEQVLCPPYDVIRDSRPEWAAKSPYNTVHLVLGGDIGGDWHKGAGRKFREWQADGALVRDPKPCFYGYDHRFTYEGRHEHRVGFIGLLRLEEKDGEVVYPHEHTFPKPRQDRLRLTEACQANLESIFLLFPDPDLRIRKSVESTRPGKTIRATDRAGSIHRFWRISDVGTIDRMRSILAPLRLLVADGHHRFATAKTYRDKQWEKTGRDPEAPYNFMMVYATAIEDPSLIVLPTHRAILKLPPELTEDPVDAIRRRFALEEFSGTPAEMAATISNPVGKGPKLGVYADGKSWFFADGPSEKGPRRGPHFMLPATLLHHEVLKKSLRMAVRPAEEAIRFFRDPAEAAALVDSGRAKLAFFLRPVSPRTVWDLARRGEMMPQKSTDFFPKLLSGLVFYGY